MVANGISKKMKIDIKSISIDIQGEIDADRGMGLSKIKSIYNIETDGAEKEIEKYVNLIEKYCTVKISMVETPEFERKINILKG